MTLKFTDNFGTGFKLWHYLRAAGHHVVFDGEFDILVNWGNEQIRGAVNGMLKPTRKDVVDMVQQQVFGYSLAIDPERHRGWAVEKMSSDHNTGKVILCPTKYDKHDHTDSDGNLQRRIYQRLIDNRVFPMDKPIHQQGEQLVRIYRASICLGQVAAVMVEDRAVVNTFSLVVPHRTYHHLLPEEQDEIVSPELKLLVLFAKKYGMDIGELTCMRDNGSGRLYVIGADFRPTTATMKQLSDCSQHDLQQRHAKILKSIRP